MDHGTTTTGGTELKKKWDLDSAGARLSGIAGAAATLLARVSPAYGTAGASKLHFPSHPKTNIQSNQQLRLSQLTPRSDEVPFGRFSASEGVFRGVLQRLSAFLERSTGSVCDGICRVIGKLWPEEPPAELGPNDRTALSRRVLIVVALQTEGQAAFVSTNLNFLPLAPFEDAVILRIRFGRNRVPPVQVRVFFFRASRGYRELRS